MSKIILLIVLLFCNRATAAHERATEADERAQNLEATLTRERLQVQESERRLVRYTFWVHNLSIINILFTEDMKSNQEKRDVELIRG